MDPYDFDPSSPLAGQRLAVPATSRTRAVGSLAERLGATVVRFRLSDGRDPERQSIEQWTNQVLEGAFDDVVFLTAQGVHLFLAYAKGRGDDDAVLDALAKTRCIARGSAVAAALGDYGIDPQLVSATESDESLLEALSAAEFRGRTVGIQLYARSRATVLRQRVRGRGGALRVLASGADTDAPVIELIELVVQGRLDCIYFSSSIQVDRLLTVSEACGRDGALRSGLAAMRVVAVGPAAAQSLREGDVRVDAVAPRKMLERPEAEQLSQSLGLGRRDALMSTNPSDEASSIVRASQRRRTVVVIGNGMVSHRFCERLVGYDQNNEVRLVVFGDEPLPAYDRVNLTSYMASKSAADLLLAEEEWYAERGIELHLGRSILSVDRERKTVRTDNGLDVRYDVLVFATGSEPFVPPIPGMDLEGVFVYRTLADLDAIRDWATFSKRAAIIGGGLLGLEAAKAVADLGVEAHVVEFAPRLMPRQLDEYGARLLQREIEKLGVHVHLSKVTNRIQGAGAASELAFSEGPPLRVDMVVVSAGILPRSDLAEAAGLAVGQRGGIVVGDDLRTEDPSIFAIGECALHRKTTYGLVAPGYDMADALAKTITGEPSAFEGSDMSTKLKLLGVDVASLGAPFEESPDRPTIVLQDLVRGVYKKLVLSEDGRQLTGAMLVGDTAEYAKLLHLVRSGEALPDNPDELVLGVREGDGNAGGLADTAQVCSCNNVTKGEICRVVRDEEATTVEAIRKCTRAGAGCGGCTPIVADILAEHLAANGGGAQRPSLCEHFSYTRQELYEVVKMRRIRSFDALIAEYGQGSGCEICKPAVASILASTHNDWIRRHETIQDTNDRFLANIQRKGLYSVIPRVPGGEITPDKLIALGAIAKKYGLYTKITGGQRIDLLGARLDQLPDIWEELVREGFESGHAYGKAMRTVKSCVGSTWCRYGVQDSVSMALRVEDRYKGVRAPHKMKAAVSGCVRECAEAQSKDFGLIATERGYNVYVGGNGGAKPRHADLLATDVDEETALRYLDRFVMYYIQTADKLTRTSVWLEKLDGGIEYLREVIIDDRLGICEQLERDMQHLVDTYQCEWASVVSDPEQRARFRHFANSDEADGNVEFVVERGQRRPTDWLDDEAPKVKLPVLQSSWVAVGRVEDFPSDGGVAIKYGDAQVAVFHFASRGKWYATQNTCPHRRDQVLARGILGDAGGVPKVACPMHKKTFSLESGECLSGDPYTVATFPVKIEDGVVLVDLPPTEEMSRLVPSCSTRSTPEVRAGV